MLEFGVRLAAEGPTDAVVGRRLLTDAGLSLAHDYSRAGKAALDRKLAGYNSAAAQSCWLVLRDLDRDAACAPALRRRLLPAPAPHMRLQIVVRAVEAWLLADADGMAELLAVPRARVPNRPDSLGDPKGCVLGLARRSRKPSVQAAMLPDPRNSSRIGPGYAATLTEFAGARWRPKVAVRRSPSLDNLCAFLARAARGGST